MTLPLIKVYPFIQFHFNSISNTGVIVEIKKVTKGKYSKYIEARVTEHVHDTPSHQGLIIYKVSFQLYK